MFGEPDGGQGVVGGFGRKRSSGKACSETRPAVARAMASSVSAEWPAPEQNAYAEGALVMAAMAAKFLEALGHTVATEVGGGELRAVAARLEPMQPNTSSWGVVTVADPSSDGSNRRTGRSSARSAPGASTRELLVDLQRRADSRRGAAHPRSECVDGIADLEWAAELVEDPGAAFQRGAIAASRNRLEVSVENRVKPAAVANVLL